MKELEGQAEGEENRRYDLYIVSENLEEEQKEEKTGHLNECFTTEEEERPSDYTALSRATTAVVRHYRPFFIFPFPQVPPDLLKIFHFFYSLDFLIELIK